MISTPRIVVTGASLVLAAVRVAAPVRADAVRRSHRHGCLPWHLYNGLPHQTQGENYPGEQTRAG